MNSITQNSLISQLLKRKIVSINENKPIFKAINILAKHNIGALPVLNSKRELCGIISERDILRQLSKDIRINLKISLINSIMTSQVITINRNINSEVIMDIMTKHKVRHIPIVDKKVLIGIVSIGDVVKRLLEKFNLENEHLKSWLY